MIREFKCVILLLICVVNLRDGVMNFGLYGLKFLKKKRKANGLKRLE